MLTPGREGLIHGPRVTGQHIILDLFSSLINRLTHYSVILLSTSTFADDILNSCHARLQMNVPEREVLRGGI